MVIDWVDSSAMPVRLPPRPGRPRQEAGTSCSATIGFQFVLELPEHPLGVPGQPPGTRRGGPVGKPVADRIQPEEVVQDHPVPMWFQPDLDRPGQFDPIQAEPAGYRPGPGRPLDALVLAVTSYRELQARPPSAPIRAVGDHR